MRIAATVFVSAALVAVAAWQAASLRVGLVVCLGFAVLAVVLVLAGRLLVALLAPLANAPSFPLRHAVLHLSRPGNQTRVILLAVGLGAFFIVGVRSLQASLLAEFSIQVNADAADMFLLDVQRGQADGDARVPERSGERRRAVETAAGAAGARHGRQRARRRPSRASRKCGPAARSAANTPSRTGTTSKPTSASWTARSGTAARRSRRCRSSGACTSASPSTSATSSASTSSAGSSTRGSSSIRDVDFKDSRAGGFMFVFRPGTLEQAPQTYIAPVKGPASGPAARARFQHDLVSRFPNVSVIDFHEILETVRDVMSKVTLAITVVGVLVLFSGGLILVGAVAMTKFQRVYEAAVFKTLGASTRKIATMLLVEYGVLGSLAGLRRIGRRRGADLGRQPLRARHSVAGVSRRARRRRGADGRARRRDRRALEPRRAPQQAAGDPPVGVARRVRVC